MRADGKLRTAAAARGHLHALVHQPDTPREPIRKLADQVAQERRLAAAGRTDEQDGRAARPQAVRDPIRDPRDLPRNAQIERGKLPQTRQCAHAVHARPTESEPMPAVDRHEAVFQRLLGSIDRVTRRTRQHVLQKERRDPVGWKRLLPPAHEHRRLPPDAQPQLLHLFRQRPPQYRLPQLGRADRDRLLHRLYHTLTSLHSMQARPGQNKKTHRIAPVRLAQCKNIRYFRLIARRMVVTAGESTMFTPNSTRKFTPTSPTSI